jgi:hypothetical protein
MLRTTDGAQPALQQQHAVVAARSTSMAAAICSWHAPLCQLQMLFLLLQHQPIMRSHAAGTSAPACLQEICRWYAIILCHMACAMLLTGCRACSCRGACQYFKNIPEWYAAWPDTMEGFAGSCR